VLGAGANLCHLGDSVKVRQVSARQEGDDERPRRQSPPSGLGTRALYSRVRETSCADVQYSDEHAAALYELLNPRAASDDFYFALVMEAGSVLDVGCGTGALLRRARDAGHAGRLCGVDPNRATPAEVWSIYGAKRAQPVATAGKSVSPETAQTSQFAAVGNSTYSAHPTPD